MGMRQLLLTFKAFKAFIRHFGMEQKLAELTISSEASGTYQLDMYTL